MINLYHSKSVYYANQCSYLYCMCFHIIPCVIHMTTALWHLAHFCDVHNPRQSTPMLLQYIIQIWINDLLHTDRYPQLNIKCYFCQSFNSLYRSSLMIAPKKWAQLWPHIEQVRACVHTLSEWTTSLWHSNCPVIFGLLLILGLVQWKCNSSACALELHLYCINPLIPILTSNDMITHFMKWINIC